MFSLLWIFFDSTRMFSILFPALSKHPQPTNIITFNHSNTYIILQTHHQTQTHILLLLFIAHISIYHLLQNCTAFQMHTDANNHKLHSHNYTQHSHSYLYPYSSSTFSHTLSINHILSTSGPILISIQTQNHSSTPTPAPTTRTNTSTQDHTHTKICTFL